MCTLKNLYRILKFKIHMLSTRGSQIWKIYLATKRHKRPTTNIRPTPNGRYASWPWHTELHLSPTQDGPYECWRWHWASSRPNAGRTVRMLAMALGFISAQRRTDGTHAGDGTGLHLGPTPDGRYACWRWHWASSRPNAEGVR